MKQAAVHNSSFSVAQTGALMRGINAILVERRLPYQISLLLKRAYYIKKLANVVFPLIRTTSPVYSNETAELDVITLLDKANVDAYLIAVKSFLYYSKLEARFTLLDDGSITPKQLTLLRRHIKGIRIIDSRSLSTQRTSQSADLQRIYKEHVHTRKALALDIQDLKETIIVMDSDVVFRRPLHRSFVDLTTVDLKYNRDHDHRQFDPLFYMAEEFRNTLTVTQPVCNLNSGLLVFRRNVVNLDVVSDFLLYLDSERKPHAVMEQDSFGLLASIVRSAPLSDEFWVGCNPDHAKPEIKRNAVAKHYVGGVRYQSLEYISDCLSLISKLWRETRQKRTHASPILK